MITGVCEGTIADDTQPFGHAIQAGRVMVGFFGAFGFDIVMHADVVSHVIVPYLDDECRIIRVWKMEFDGMLTKGCMLSGGRRKSNVRMFQDILMLCGVSVCTRPRYALTCWISLRTGTSWDSPTASMLPRRYTDSSCTAFLALVESSMHNSWMAVSELKMKCGCNCSVNSFALLSANSCSARIRRSSLLCRRRMNSYHQGERDGRVHQRQRIMAILHDSSGDR